MADPKVGLELLTDHSGSWDWENAHVGQAVIDSTSGDPETDRKDLAINDIVEAGTVLIAAGPADLDKALSIVGGTGGAIGSEGIRIVPIGLVETAQISMNKPLSRIFEIGSFLSYIIPGRAVGGISLSRVFFDGPSLLKVLYAGEVVEDSASVDAKYAKFASTKTEAGKAFAHIGSGNLAMNLASRFFNQPVGLAFFFKDQESDTVSQIYFEGCRVGTWNMGISANMNVLTEAVNIEFVRCRPVVTAATTDKVAGDGKLADTNIVSAHTNDASD